MAQRTIVRLVDDLTGEELSAGGGGTIQFGLDGTSYEIDLSTSNTAAMRDSLSRYVSHARRTTPSGRAHAPVATAVDSRAVRAWAASNGVELSARGRIPSAVIEQFRAAGH
jgi:hypothetical protein